jgi:hypothetical protein
LTKKQPIETKVVESLKEIGRRLVRFSLKVDLGGFMSIEYPYLRFIKDCLDAFRKESANADKILDTATWGYQNIFISMAEAESVFGKEKAGKLLINASCYYDSFGLRVIPAKEMETLSDPETKKRHGIDERLDIISATVCKRKRHDFWDFESYSVFEALGCGIRTFDLTPFTGAEIPFDMTTPIDAKYHRRFDVVLDSGTTEHCSNPRQSFENTVNMLKHGGVYISRVPLNQVGESFYNIDALFFHDFFESNGFAVLDCFYMLRRESERHSLLNRNSLKFGMPSKPGDLYFFAQKRKKLDEIRIPIQTCYAIYQQTPYSFTHGPLLDAMRRTRVAAPDSPTVMETARPIKTGLYNSFMDNIALIATEEQVREIASITEFQQNPYLLRKPLEDILLQKIETHLEQEAARLAGRKAFFWIEDRKLYFKRKGLFARTEVAALLTTDSKADGLELTGMGAIPVKFYRSAYCADPEMPVVVFAGKIRCSQVYNIFQAIDRSRHPDVISCWK